MERDTSFDDRLVAALTAVSTDAQNPKLTMAAALALRTWCRHQALVDKPELIVRLTPNELEVFGGAKLVKHADGSLALHGGDPAWRDMGMNHIVGALADSARAKVQQEYFAKAMELAKGASVNFDELPWSTVLFLTEKVSIPWWRPKCTPTIDKKVLGKLAWDNGLFDREAQGIAIRVWGMKLSVAAYNLCCANREALKARIAEAPHMAPLLAGVLGGKGRFLRKQEPKLDTHPMVWKDLKDRFIEDGGTPQGWRWLCGQGHAWSADLRDRWYGSTIKCINLIAELQLGKIPLAFCMVHMLDSNQNPASLQYQSRVAVFKAAMLAYRQRQLTVRDMSQVTLILDWLNRTEASAKGATWASLMRKQRVWHMEEARRMMAERERSGECQGWAPLVQSMEVEGWEAIALTNSDALWEEGRIMAHCVGGYDRHCANNTSRIWSIRRNGERIATLELTNQGRKAQRKDAEAKPNLNWEVRQLYGPGNTVLDRKSDVMVQKLIRKLLTACRKAEPLKRADCVVLRSAAYHEERLAA